MGSRSKNCLPQRENYMAADNSFDIVSKVDIQGDRNAIDQASKINARFDLKNSNSSIKLKGDDTIQLASADEYKLKAVIEILQQEEIGTASPKTSLRPTRSWSKPPATASGKRSAAGHRQRINKEIVRVIKDSKKKMRASIQGETVRITGRNHLILYKKPLRC